jgi:hypothetical protein
MTIATLSRYDPIKGCFVLKDFNPKPPANAFEWKRYVVEEAIRRGDKPSTHDVSYERSTMSTKTVERVRETNPSYGTVPFTTKTEALIALKPKQFTIYSKAQKTKGDLK